MKAMTYRLTQYAHGGGCACKIPPGELEDMVRGLTTAAPRDPVGELLVGLDDGDDAAVVRISGGTALIATTDFFTPVVDDAYDWGRIAAANALSDVYAMGGRPVVAVNLLGWPREVLPLELAAETLRGGLDVCGLARAATSPAGTASTTRNPSTGWRSPVSPTRIGCCATTPASPGTPLSLTKPLGIGVLNSGTRPPARSFPAGDRGDDHAQRRRRPCRAGRGSRMRHRRNRFRAARTPAQAGPRQRRHRGDRLRRRCPTSTARARPSRPATSAAARAATSTGWRHMSTCRAVDEDEALLLADAQTSGGLLIAGEIPGAPVIGELVPRGEHTIVVR